MPTLAILIDRLSVRIWSRQSQQSIDWLQIHELITSRFLHAFWSCVHSFIHSINFIHTILVHCGLSAHTHLTCSMSAFVWGGAAGWLHARFYVHASLAASFCLCNNSKDVILLRCCHSLIETIWFVSFFLNMTGGYEFRPLLSLSVLSNEMMISKNCSSQQRNKQRTLSLSLLFVSLIELRVSWFSSSVLIWTHFSLSNQNHLFFLLRWRHKQMQLWSCRQV